MGGIWYFTNDSPYLRAYRWTGESREELQDLGSAHGGGPIEITESGWVLGTRKLGQYSDSEIQCYVWRGPGSTLLLPNTFGNQNQGTSINELEEVVGVASQGQSNPVPFLYANGIMHDLRQISDINRFGSATILPRCILNDGTIFGDLQGSVSFIARRVR